MSEDVAYSRIQAARTARKFPALFHAVAEDRLHLTGVGLLAPHLTPENATELIEAATHKSKSEIELLLAHRFPKPDVATFVRALPSKSLMSTMMAPAQTSINERRLRSIYPFRNGWKCVNLTHRLVGRSPR